MNATARRELETLIVRYPPLDLSTPHKQLAVILSCLTTENLLLLADEVYAIKATRA